MLYAACVQSGIVFLPLNTAYTANEVNYFVEDSGASLMVCSPERKDELTMVANTHDAQLLTQSEHCYIPRAPRAALKAPC